MAFAKELAEPWDGMGSMANHQRKLAAEMILRLYNRCTMEAQHTMQLRQQVEELRADRDALRRTLSRMYIDPNAFAASKGWNCFRESK